MGTFDKKKIPFISTEEYLRLVDKSKNKKAFKEEKNKMRKCPFCGGRYDNSLENCSHCGAENELCDGE